MGIELPKHLKEYVDRMVAEGTYASEDAALAAGLEALQREELRMSELRAAVELGLQASQTGRMSGRTISDILADEGYKQG